MLFLRRRVLETRKGFIEFHFIERVAHLADDCAKRDDLNVCQHKVRLTDAPSQGHDLIGGLMFQHSILVNARSCANAFEPQWLYSAAQQCPYSCDDLADRAIACVDSRFEIEDMLASLQRHNTSSSDVYPARSPIH